MSDETFAWTRTLKYMAQQIPVSTWTFRPDGLLAAEMIEFNPFMNLMAITDLGVLKRL